MQLVIYYTYQDNNLKISAPRKYSGVQMTKRVSDNEPWRGIVCHVHVVSLTRLLRAP